MANEGKMTVEEAGRKGGEKTAKTHGRQFYQQIGRKGGEARANDPDVRSGELGRMGGKAVSKNREHMAEIGRKGGQSKGRTAQKVI